MDKNICEAEKMDEMYLIKFCGLLFYIGSQPKGSYINGKHLINLKMRYLCKKKLAASF